MVDGKPAELDGLFFAGRLEAEFEALVEGGELRIVEGNEGSASTADNGETSGRNFLKPMISRVFQEKGHLAGRRNEDGSVRKRKLVLTEEDKRCVKVMMEQADKNIMVSDCRARLLELRNSLRVPLYSYDVKSG